MGVRILPTTRTAKVVRAFLPGHLLTPFNVVKRSAAAVTERDGGFLNHERHETHEKESLLAVAGASNVFSTTEDTEGTEDTERWALVERSFPVDKPSPA